MTDCAVGRRTANPAARTTITAVDPARVRRRVRRRPRAAPQRHGGDNLGANGAIPVLELSVREVRRVHRHRSDHLLCNHTPLSHHHLKVTAARLCDQTGPLAAGFVAKSDGLAAKHDADGEAAVFEGGDFHWAGDDAGDQSAVGDDHGDAPTVGAFAHDSPEGVVEVA
jgi:hypothetical protein